MSVLNETRRTLMEAAASLPGRPHISTLIRWHRRGIRGTKLETVVIGGRRFTSVEALERFAEATTAAADGQPQPIRTSKQRERAIEQAEAELRREGVGTSTRVAADKENESGPRPSNKESKGELKRQFAENLLQQVIDSSSL